MLSLKKQSAEFYMLCYGSDFKYRQKRDRVTSKCYYDIGSGFRVVILFSSVYFM